MFKKWNDDKRELELEKKEKRAKRKNRIEKRDRRRWIFSEIFVNYMTPVEISKIVALYRVQVYELCYDGMVLYGNRKRGRMRLMRNNEFLGKRDTI